MSKVYQGRLHQHHKDNIAEVLKLVNEGVSDNVIKNVFSIKLQAQGYEGSFTRGKTEDRILNFDSTLNRYSRDRFNRKLANFMSEVERKSNLGSRSYTVRILSDKGGEMAKIVLA